MLDDELTEALDAILARSPDGPWSLAELEVLTPPPLRPQRVQVHNPPYRVTREDGAWAVRDRFGFNAYEPGWRWNTRMGARQYKIECEYDGHIVLTAGPIRRG